MNKEAEGTGMGVANLKTNVSSSPVFPRVGSVTVNLYYSQAPIHLTVAAHTPFHQQDKLGMRKQTRKPIITECILSKEDL